MLDKRNFGATFALEDLGWIDFESRSTRTSITAGTEAYARDAEAIMLAWSIGAGPVTVNAVQSFDRPLSWNDMPVEFHDFYAKVLAGEAHFVAHHATFDRYIWNLAAMGFPPLYPDMIIDTRVQAQANGLPARLDLANKYVGGGGKDAAGKDYIKLFCNPGCTATPQSHPEEWAGFIDYAGRDIDSMREVFQRSRQISLAEWEEYWASENINDRGMGIDLHLARQAADLAAIDKRISNVELHALTGGAISTVDQVASMKAWLIDALDPLGRDILISRYEEIDTDTGEVVKPQKSSLTRDRVGRVIAYLQALDTLTPRLEAALRVAQIRYYGGSKTPAKFGKMVTTQVGGVLRAQYTFHGAHTGRFSAKGIQVHNLVRDALPYEMDLLDALAAGRPHSEIAVLGDATPVSRKLSLVIRPTIVPAAPGKVFVWGDWSNIEARVLPWLADDREADKRLEIFRQVDADPTIPDIYVRTAAKISHIAIEAVTKKIRQRGKVTELAAGFGGAVGALLAMGAGYGIYIDESEARTIINEWRAENPWAVRFWGFHGQEASYGLWGAINRAREALGTVQQAGRINYTYTPFMGGTAWCILPSRRVMTYRRLHWEEVIELDEDTKEEIGRHSELMFSRDMGRVKLWPGLCAENVVQAVAADILRGTLVRLEAPEYEWMPVRLHTHDEVLVEVDEDRAEEAAAALVAVMERGWDWTDGLPIKADATIGRWYTKLDEATGL